MTICENWPKVISIQWFHREMKCAVLLDSWFPSRITNRSRSLSTQVSHLVNLLNLFEQWVMDGWVCRLFQHVNLITSHAHHQLSVKVREGGAVWINQWGARCSRQIYRKIHQENMHVKSTWTLYTNVYRKLKNDL